MAKDKDVIILTRPRDTGCYFREFYFVSLSAPWQSLWILENHAALWSCPQWMSYYIRHYHHWNFHTHVQSLCTHLLHIPVFGSLFFEVKVLDMAFLTHLTQRYNFCLGAKFCWLVVGLKYFSSLFWREGFTGCSQIIIWHNPFSWALRPYGFEAVNFTKILDSNTRFSKYIFEKASISTALPL